MTPYATNLRASGVIPLIGSHSKTAIIGVMRTAELYDKDFVEWTRHNAELLRAGRASEADLEHIAEEIEDMGKRERRSLQNRCVRLIEHLLQWQYQPERRGSSWTRTIILQRRNIRRLLDENPSFRPGLIELVAQAYDDAAAVVAGVTNQPRSAFPESCPFTVEQLLTEGFLP
jgi:hypothetical protein